MSAPESVSTVIQQRDRARELLKSTEAQVNAHLQARLVAELSAETALNAASGQSVRAQRAEATIKQLTDPVAVGQMVREQLIEDADVTLPHFALMFFGKVFVELLEKAPNYVVSTMLVKDFGDLTITVQRKTGKSPGQMHAEEKARADALEARVKELEHDLAAGD